MEKATDLIANTPELQAKETEADLVTRMAAASELAENPEVVKEIRKYGKVPVIYSPKRAVRKAMLRPAGAPGLTHFIKNATTIKEVENLLARGNTYENIHPKTLNTWKKLANKKIAQLNSLKNK